MAGTQLPEPSLLPPDLGKANLYLICDLCYPEMSEEESHTSSVSGPWVFWFRSFDFDFLKKWEKTVLEKVINNGGISSTVDTFK